MLLYATNSVFMLNCNIFPQFQKAALQNFPDSTDDICPVFVSNFVSVMQSVNSLLSHLSDVCISAELIYTTFFL